MERPKVVAVIDDDPSMLRAAHELLSACGFATELFTSAEEFLGSGDSTAADCLLLDIQLDGMSGIELRRQLIKSHANLPVIFITGLDDEETRAQARQVGCIAYLRKPYSARLLKDAIAKALFESGR